MRDLTDEWKQRGVTSSQEFAILTNEIMQGTFALKVDEYKQVKALAREYLRDHMTDIELILTMLGEATTTKLHRDRDSVGMPRLTACNGRNVRKADRQNSIRVMASTVRLISPSRSTMRPSGASSRKAGSMSGAAMA